jgi:excisionase family DNA binding protein
MSVASEKAAFSVAEVAHICGLSRSTLYIEMASGRLPFRKLGARRLILAADLADFLQALPSGSKAA